MFKVVVACSVLLNALAVNQSKASQKIHSYEDIFTRNIYDDSSKLFIQRWNEYQARMTHPVPVEKAVKREQKLAHLAWKETKHYKEISDRTALGVLYFQKLKYVEERLVSPIRQQIDQLKQLQEIIKGTNTIKGKGAAAKTLPLITSLVFSANPLAGVADIFSKLIGYSSDASANLADDLAKHSGELQKAITALKVEMHRYRHGVSREPIKDLEEKYILKKDRLSPDLQNLIENNFINSRKPLYPFPFVKQCLEHALDLPTGPKVLDTDNLLSSFRISPFFNKFNVGTRESLEDIITAIAQFSRVKDVQTTHPLRGIYYFWGSAGIGKSESAERLAKLMKLPYSKQTIIRPSVDFSSANLEGTTFLAPTANQGWLSRPLLTFPDKESESQETVENALLILEDFHKVLEDKQSLSFILYYFDPRRTDYQSPYFNGKVRIKRMSVILTGNTDIPQTEEFKAVRERFTQIVKFTPFQSPEKKAILKDYALEAKEIFSVDNNGGFRSEQAALDYVIKSAEILAGDTNSIRSCERSIDNILTGVRARGWSSTKRSLLQKIKELSPNNLSPEGSDSTPEKRSRDDEEVTPNERVIKKGRPKKSTHKN